MGTNSLGLIQEKITSIQNGLLRLAEKENREDGIHVQVVSDEDDKLCCTMLNTALGKTKSLSQKKITLVHKHNSNYLFVAGKVLKQVTFNKFTILSVRIVKAGWFVKQSKGNVSWLNEMHSYVYPGKFVS